ncbi:unnamed protein product [Discosporangium mesarthrocarpum]
MGSMELRIVSSPRDPGVDLTARRHDKQELDKTRYLYANILGKLMFLAAMTRPDLSNSVRELGRRSSSPCLRHWPGLQHVLRYLAGTTDIAIHYPRGTNADNEQLITGYADSDWANDPETRRSVTGYCAICGQVTV